MHRDIKPHNLVLFGLKWKVIDLESARRAGEPVSMKVSPSYCSPELARAVLGKQADRMRAACTLDLWSFGLVRFELFARHVGAEIEARRESGDLDEGASAAWRFCSGVWASRRPPPAVTTQRRAVWRRGGGRTARGVANLSDLAGPRRQHCDRGHQFE